MYVIADVKEKLCFYSGGSTVFEKFTGGAQDPKCSHLLL
jgi:hypothetical protein